jgi:hypothetical protein
MNILPDHKGQACVLPYRRLDSISRVKTTPLKFEAVVTMVLREPARIDLPWSPLGTRRA